MERQYKHLFGPVPSRRLGRSLGVDLVPFKVCPIDCIYCEVGRTTFKTIRRDEYVPTEEILDELRQKLAEGAPIDVITITGSGEPTLHNRLGEIIQRIKALTPIPVAVLTNGNLLYDAVVRHDLAAADMVLPSLDAADAHTYARINRPCEEATFERLVEGLLVFRREYRGRIYLEVFFVAGVNDSEEQAQKMRALIDQIKPDRVDVNTVIRPPAESDSRAVDPHRLLRLCKILGPGAQIIVPMPLEARQTRPVTEHDILELLRRRPCTLDDLVAGLAAGHGEVHEQVGRLLADGRLRSVRQDGKDYLLIKV